MVYPLSENDAGTTWVTNVPRPGSATSSLSRMSSLTISAKRVISISSVLESDTKILKIFMQAIPSLLPFHANAPS